MTCRHCGPYEVDAAKWSTEMTYRPLLRSALRDRHSPLKLFRKSKRAEARRIIEILRRVK